MFGQVVDAGWVVHGVAGIRLVEERPAGQREVDRRQVGVAFGQFGERHRHVLGGVDGAGGGRWVFAERLEVERPRGDGDRLAVGGLQHRRAGGNACRLRVAHSVEVERLVDRAEVGRVSLEQGAQLHRERFERVRIVAEQYRVGKQTVLQQVIQGCVRAVLVAVGC